MRKMTMLCVTLLALTTVAACADALGVPLILLTNSWQEVDNTDHVFNITDDTDFVPSTRGTFTGTEDDGNDDFELEGDWNNGRIRMTVFRDPVVTWRATVRRDNPDTLVFTRTVGTGVDSLVLFRFVDLDPFR